MNQAMSTLTINGSKMEIPDGTTVADFLEIHNLQAKSVVVEVNKVIIDRDRYGVTVLNNDDVVEIVRFIGGG